MKADLETTCEQYFIELFRAHGGLKGKKFFHEEEDRQSETNCIVIGAKQGKDLLEGARGPNKELRSSVEVTATYRSTTATVAMNNLVVANMHEAIRNAASAKTKTQQRLGFYLMILNEDINGDRSQSDNLRSRSITIPCEAGLLYS